jgi:transposase
MMSKVNTIRLHGGQRRALEKIAAKASESAGVARRALVVLWTADGVAAQEIASRLHLTPEAVSRIRRRFLDGGVGSLADRPKTGRKDHVVPEETIQRVVELALSPPPAGRTRWTTRLLANEVGISKASVSNILRREGLKPHRVRTYKVSRDPQFASKVKDIVGLYLNPPEHAVVLSVDEKTSIQALERTQPPLPMRSGRAARHTHDYKRHGVIDLYAALDIASGEVTHTLTNSHTAKDFLSFMNKVVRVHPNQELHVVLDNSSTHRTPDVKKWLEDHPRVHFHYTPTSASWLNQVEGFFGILAKQALSTTDFHSKKALRDHLRAFLRSWNRNPTPFEWTRPAKPIIRSYRRALDRLSKTMH